MCSAGNGIIDISGGNDGSSGNGGSRGNDSSSGSGGSVSKYSGSGSGS